MNLPYATHTWILPVIISKPPIACQFECRFLKFFLCMLCSTNSVVSIFAQSSLTNALSPLGRNVAFLRDIRGVIVSEDLTCTCNQLNHLTRTLRSRHALSSERETQAMCARELMMGSVGIEHFDVGDFYRIVFLLCTDRLN